MACTTEVAEKSQLSKWLVCTRDNFTKRFGYLFNNVYPIFVAMTLQSIAHKLKKCRDSAVKRKTPASWCDILPIYWTSSLTNVRMSLNKTHYVLLSCRPIAVSFGVQMQYLARFINSLMIRLNKTSGAELLWKSIHLNVVINRRVCCILIN